MVGIDDFPKGRSCSVIFIMLVLHDRIASVNRDSILV